MLSLRDQLFGDCAAHEPTRRTLLGAVDDDPGLIETGADFQVATVKNDNVAVTTEVPDETQTTPAGVPSWSPKTWRLLKKGTEVGIRDFGSATWVTIRVRPGTPLFDEQGQPAGSATEYTDYYTRKRNIGAAIAMASTTPAKKKTQPASNLKLPKGDDSGTSTGTIVGLLAAGAAVAIASKKTARRRRRR